MEYSLPKKILYCTDAYASYLSESAFSPGDPGSGPIVYRDDIGIHLQNATSGDGSFNGVLPYNSGTGGFVISVDAGEVWGNPIPNCETLINGQKQQQLAGEDEASFVLIPWSIFSINPSLLNGTW